jgi:hypothetical protein
MVVMEAVIKLSGPTPNNTFQATRYTSATTPKGVCGRLNSTLGAFLKIRYLNPRLLMLAASLPLSGCVGMVSGDFKNVPPASVPECRAPLPEYRLKIESTAQNDYGHSNPSGLLSTLTLGLLPTYWHNSVQVHAVLYQGSQQVGSYHYAGKVRTFYGALWPVALHPGNGNRLGWNEGTGLEVVKGLRERATAKALAQFGVPSTQACYFVTLNP